MTNEIVIYTDNDDNRALSTERRNPLLSPARAYINTLSQRSRNTAFQALKKFANVWLDVIEEETQQTYSREIDVFSLDWHHLSYNHMSLIRAKIGDMIANRDISSSYANIVMAAIKGVLKECQRMGLMNREDLANITDFKSFKINHKRKGTLLEVDEIRALLGVCDNSSLGIRDAAIIAILASTGMRRQELCSLRVEDVNLNTRRVQIISGKGNKDRVAFLKPEAVKRVKAWLDIRPQFEDNPYLLLPVQRYGYIANRQLNTQTIQLVLRERSKQAGITEVKPHDLRKFMASTLLLSGADIAQVSKLLGHANLKTTADHYDLRHEDELKKAADILPNIDF